MHNIECFGKSLSLLNEIRKSFLGEIIVLTELMFSSKNKPRIVIRNLLRLLKILIKCRLEKNKLSYLNLFNFHDDTFKNKKIFGI